MFEAINNLIKKPKKRPTQAIQALTTSISMHSFVLFSMYLALTYYMSGGLTTPPFTEFQLNTVAILLFIGFPVFYIATNSDKELLFSQIKENKLLATTQLLASIITVYSLVSVISMLYILSFMGTTVRSNLAPNIKHFAALSDAINNKDCSVIKDIENLQKFIIHESHPDLVINTLVVNRAYKSAAENGCIDKNAYEKIINKNIEFANLNYKNLPMNIFAERIRYTLPFIYYMNNHQNKFLIEKLNSTSTPSLTNAQKQKISNI